MSDILDRLVVLFKEDKELHDALVGMLNFMSESHKALAEFRRRRAKK